jgi:hypothetical protein
MVRARLTVRHLKENGRGNEANNREPADAALTVRKNDEGRSQRSKCLAKSSAQLKQGLSQTVLPSGRHSRNARRFRMKYGRAQADQNRCQDQA